MASSLANCHKTPRKMDQKSYRVEPRTYHLDKNSNESKKTNQERREDDLNKFVKKRNWGHSKKWTQKRQCIACCFENPHEWAKKDRQYAKHVIDDWRTQHCATSRQHDDDKKITHLRPLRIRCTPRQAVLWLSLCMQKLCLNYFCGLCNSSRHIVVSQFLSGLIEPIAQITRPGFRWFSTVSRHRSLTHRARRMTAVGHNFSEFCHCHWMGKYLIVS